MPPTNLISPPKVIHLPLFLAPVFSFPSTITFPTSSSRRFTNTCIWNKYRRKGEKNKTRGVSAIRSTGPKYRLSISKFPLPEPVTNAEKRAEFTVDDQHGLWGFFNEARQPMVPPEDEGAHGRAWEYQELSYKSFEDLHKLHWICIKELNRSLTRAKEMRRVKAGYGELESETRIKTIKTTMKRIREVLLDRHNTWAQARAILEKTTVKELFESESEQAFENNPRLSQDPIRQN